MQPKLLWRTRFETLTCNKRREKKKAETRGLCSEKHDELPETLRVLVKKLKRFGGDGIRVGAEEEVLDPTHVTVCADSLAAVAERVGRTGIVFLGLALHEEPERFILQTGYHLEGNAMVDHLEETNLLAGLDHDGFGIRAWEINLRNLREHGGGVACLGQKQLV